VKEFIPPVRNKGREKFGSGFMGVTMENFQSFPITGDGLGGGPKNAQWKLGWQCPWHNS
jgi:hypothetical protein